MSATIKAKVKLKGATKPEANPDSSFAYHSNRFACLIDDLHQSEWGLGECLCAMRDAGKAEGHYGKHATLGDYVEKEHSFSHRTAQLLMANYGYLSAAGVDTDKASNIGWTKLALIVRHKPEDLAGWLDKAMTLTRRQLEQALAPKPSAPKPGTVAAGKAVTPSKIAAKQPDDKQPDKLTEATGAPSCTLTTACGHEIATVTGPGGYWIDAQEAIQTARNKVQAYLDCADDPASKKAAGRAFDHLQKALAELQKTNPGDAS